MRILRNSLFLSVAIAALLVGPMRSASAAYLRVVPTSPPTVAPNDPVPLTTIANVGDTRNFTVELVTGAGEGFTLGTYEIALMTDPAILALSNPVASFSGTFSVGLPAAGVATVAYVGSSSIAASSVSPLLTFDATALGIGSTSLNIIVGFGNTTTGVNSVTGAPITLTPPDRRD